jgi:hypothetical protein
MNINFKVWIKRTTWICLLPVGLILLFGALFYIPAVQDVVFRNVLASISESSGIRINAARIRLSFPLNLSVQELSLTDEALDTLAYISQFKASVDPLPLLSQEVSVAGIHLEKAHFSTKTLIEGMQIDGMIGNLMIDAGQIHLLNEDVSLRRFDLSDTDLILQIDSSATDTTQTVNNWKVGMDAIQFQHVAFAVRIPADSFRIASDVDTLVLSEGRISFGDEQYSALQLLLSGARVSFDLGGQPVKMGLDPSHIALSELNTEIDSLFWKGEEISATIRSFTAGERSGLRIASMQGSIRNDGEALTIPRWSLRTPSSDISLQAAIPWQAMEKQPQGAAGRIQWTVALDRQDVLTLLGEWAKTVERSYPPAKLTFTGLLEGNSDRLYLRRLQSQLPGVFQAEMVGDVEKVTDEVHRSGKFHLTASARGKQLLPDLLPAEYAGRLAFPDSLWLNMQAALEKGEYRTELLLSELQGKAQLSGRYHARKKEYLIEVKADSLALDHFLPQDSIRWLTAALQAEGKGMDLYAESTRIQLKGELSEMQYQNRLLSGVSLDGELQNHHFHASLTSNYPYVRGNVTMEGMIDPDKISAVLIVDMDSLDLYGLNLTDMPLSNSFQLFSEMETDLQKRHRLDMTLGNWTMALGRRQVKPKTMTLLADCNQDTTHISFHTGDLAITLLGNAGAEQILQKLNAVSNEFNRQMAADSVFISLPQLRPLWPDMRLTIEAAHDNPVYNYLQVNDLFFDRLALNASTSPDEGLQLQASVLALVKDTLKIDTLRINILQDTLGLQFAGDVVKQRFRRQEPFTAGWQGYVQEKNAGIELFYRNARGDAGLTLGARAEKQPDGINLHLQPDPVIAFLPFSVNPDNYVLVKNLRDISANLRLDGEENASIGLHSAEADGRMRELFFEINQIGLDKISTSFANIPPMQGLSSLSLRYVPSDSSYMVVAEAGIENLSYQGETVGNLLLNGVYLPVDNENSQVDMHLFHGQDEISTLSALYPSDQNKPLEGTFEIHHCPLTLLNPFLTGTAQLGGTLRGAVNFTGKVDKPLLNGYLQLDTTTAYITAADTRLRFDTQRVEIEDSKLQFRTYGIYATGNNPFVVDGIIDLRNPARSIADLKLTAHNMQLLNARQKRESIVYGKMFVNLSSTVKGPLDALKMRGDLHLLGNTNMTYVMKSSPLAAQDRMADLVTFTYFLDTIPRKDRRALMLQTRREFVSIDGLDMLLTIRLDPAVKLKIDLDEEASGRIELEGGGDLSLQYTQQRDLLLTGRYTLSGGLVRYNMPVIANKTLHIKENSYIEWTGDPFDPFLNLKATERYRSYVGADGQRPHLVNFDAGIELKQRMENLALQFTLDALDDATLQDQLAAMGAEERSKQAISMLLTGMYLGDDGSGKSRMDMGMALNSFLQHEVNHLAGNMLKGVDFNFGMESYDGTPASGSGRKTDYSFRFSKRFYNDRFNLILGGLVSTDEVAGQSNTFINDAAIEYRLDTGGSRYARLFYNRQYESFLEGEIAKYGAGVVFRRKMRNVIDLFRFRAQKPNINQ